MESLPMRGEWIEILWAKVLTSETGSLPMRGEWIEIQCIYHLCQMAGVSLPMRGEWIEIERLSRLRQAELVSPHAGRVD